eukprot:TRINITY_DN27829_c0_g1_i1.p1 TRINITY_DN27829_c0_g1~~TRINITY_DN27829_c0_g1_i1.p1  ORF type:complete len:864 (+),score=223.10 TRINITY_DN27829_c0_g1_i1:314-2593(+)
MPARKRQDGRPSTVARHENMKKEAIAFQLQQNSKAAASVGLDDPDAIMSGGLDSVDVLKAAFTKDIKGVIDRLEDLTKNLRNDSTKQEEALRRKREEERRQQEEEKRLARKREQAARDPKKKVTLRLENRRRFAQDDSESAKIPMCPLQVDGKSGRETVSLVDITAIRRRCTLLGEGQVISVESLIDHQRIRDKAAQDKEAMKKHALALQREAQATAAATGVSTGFRVTELPWEERHGNCLAKKEASQMEDILRKLSRMRSELPTGLSIQTETLEAALEHDRLRRETMAMLDPSKAGEDNWGEIFGDLAEKLASSSDSRPSSLSRSLNRLSHAATGGEMVICAKTSGPVESGKRNSVTELELHQALLQKRIRVLRASMKAASRWVLLFRRTRKRNEMAEVIKLTMREFGEWARVKLVMKKTVASVRKIQAISKEFLARKKQRCRIIEQEWQRIEDKNLEQFFFKNSQQLIKEQMTQAEENPRGNLAQNARARQMQKGFFEGMLNAVKQGELAINWKTFRIPAHLRQKVISGHYMGQLRTRVRTTSDLLKTTKMVLAKHRELVGFLQKLGGSVEDGEGSSFLGQDLPNRSKVVAYWHVPEETMLCLIGLAAQILKATDVAPFEGHPANKDLPGNCMYLRPQKDFKAAAEQGQKQLDQAMVQILTRSSLRRTLKKDEAPVLPKSKSMQSWQGRQAPKQVSTSLQSAGSIEEEAKLPVRQDIEDVFEAFTPRLREIKDEQMLQYRLDNPVPAERSTGPMGDD